MRFPFLFKATKIDGGSEPPPSQSWPWPSCNKPRTLSFRSGAADTCPSNPPESFAGDEVTEAMLRDLRSSERLFFDPGETSPKLGGSETASFCLVSVESRDPVADFRGSMEEMVGAHGLLGWAGLEELLRCYLKVNGAHNHGYIVGAFVDLLVGLAVNATANDETTSRGRRRRDSPVSTLSFYTSSESSSTSSTAITREIEEQLIIL